DRGHAAARRVGHRVRRGVRRDPPDGGRERPRLLQRPAELDVVRDRRGDPPRGRARQPVAAAEARRAPAGARPLNVHVPLDTTGRSNMRSTGHNARRAAIAVAVVALLATVAAAAALARPTSHQAKTVHLAFIYPGTFANFAQEMAIGAKAAAAHTPGV